MGIWNELLQIIATMQKLSLFSKDDAIVQSYAYHVARIIDQNLADKSRQITRDCSRHSLSRMPVISNFHCLELFFGPFSSSSNSPYNYIRYLKPHYLELLLCQTNFSVPSALLSRYLELFHLDVRFLKKTVQKLWDSIECLSFCVHL